MIATLYGRIAYALSVSIRPQREHRTQRSQQAMDKHMQLQLIRNATLRLRYAGHMILIDPDLAAKHSRPSFTGRSPNPMVDLPVPLAEIVTGLDLVIVSHLHRDHFDAVEPIAAALPVLCQPGDEARIAERGFAQVTPLADALDWGGIHLERTAGQHGTGEVGQMMGSVAGFVFAAPGEPTIYWAGDTVLYDEIEAAIERYQPDIIITHSCGARWPDAAGERQLIVMDATQTVALAQLAPSSIVIATHMEALDHATISRAELRAAADAAGISPTRLLIPADGQELRFE
jgi:L-ascorbate metabolism protein UlaG (beta-lactamase superfamily)